MCLNKELGVHVEHIYILIIIIGIILHVGAIISVWIEEILYSTKVKILKTFFIILVPFIGAIIELYVSRKHNKVHKESVDNTDNVPSFPGAWHIFRNGNSEGDIS
jgi:hypothetical protein